MRNEKGQALIEFVLILPLFLLMVIGTIDLGNIVYKKYSLEGKLDYVVDLYKNESEVKLNNYLNEENLDVTLNQKASYTEIILIDHSKVSTPILKEIIGNNYKIEAKRTIYEE